MNFNKKIKSRFKLFLRRLGLICKKPRTPKRKIYVSRSINYDGSVTEYDAPLDHIPMNQNSFQSELHVWKEIHKDTKLNDKSK